MQHRSSTLAVLSLCSLLLVPGSGAVSLQTALDQLVSRLDPQTPRSGGIVKAHYTTAYVDRGEAHGVKVGDRYDVVTEVTEMRDAASGEVVARRRVITGRIEVLHLQADVSVCKLVDGVLTLSGDDRTPVRAVHLMEADKSLVSAPDARVGTGLVITVADFRQALQGALAASESWRLTTDEQATWELRTEARLVGDRCRVLLTLVDPKTDAAVAEVSDVYDITTAPPSQRMGERLAKAMALSAARNWEAATKEFDAVLQGFETRGLREVEVRRLGLTPEQWCSYAEAVSNTARQKSDYERACDYCRYTIALDSSNPFAWTGLAYTIGMFLGDLDSAWQFYDGGLKACGGRDGLFRQDRQMWQYEEIRLARARGTSAAGGGQDGEAGTPAAAPRPAEVSELLARLDDGSEADREQAIQTLGSLGYDAPFSELIARAAAPSATVQRSAVRTLELLGDAGLKALVEALAQESSPERRVGAELALTQMHESAALHILKSLGDVSADTRSRCVRILARIGEPAAPFLVKALWCREPESVNTAVEAMVQMQDPPVDRLIAALSDPAPQVRKTASGTLRRLGDAAVAELIRAFRRDDPRIREEAARILASMNPPPLPILVRALGLRGSKEIREGAATVLARINPPPVSELVDALEHQDPYLRKNAVSLLGVLGSDAAVAPLSRLLGSDPAVDVRCAAAAALGDIGDARAVPGLVQALSTPDEDIRYSVVTALGKVGGEAAAEALLRILNSADTDLRGYAAEALGHTRSPGAVGPLIDVLKTGKDVFVRRSAAEALGRIGGSTAADALGDALHDTQIRDKAKTALIAVGEPATETLLNALRSRESAVRQSAAEALGVIGDSRAAKPLCSLLTDESLVRTTARDALVAIGRPAMGELRQVYDEFSRRSNNRSRSARTGEIDPELLALQAARDAMQRIRARGLRGEPPAAAASDTARPGQTAIPLIAPAARGSFRKWQHGDGDLFTARFVGSGDGVVHLEDAEGRVRSVSVGGLSSEDQDWLTRHLERIDAKP